MIITTITMIKKMDWDVDWDSLERAWDNVDLSFDWDVDLDLNWDIDWDFDWDIDFFSK